MKAKRGILRILLPLATMTILGACASIGRPEGGMRDEIPPSYVKSNPDPGALNYTDNRVDIWFDENIKLDDVMNKVVVSPVQRNTPRVNANGRHLRLDLQDSILPDVTYTIDFSDAIRDLNEGNILDGFAFDFSTGAVRDSLVISGMLFEAHNLEPAQGMIVGVYSNLADSAISTLPMDRIAKTNQYGQFIIRNLAPGTYNLFAVNDVNRDYHWDRSENIAFYPAPIVPVAESIMVCDTLRASNGRDSIVERQGVRYLPNDILLTWFNEDYHPQYLKTHSRIDSTRIELIFNAASDTLPTLTVTNGPLAGKSLDEISVIDRSQPGDSLTYWLTDKRAISQDTLILATRYLRTDSIDSISWTTDTLTFINKSRSKTPDKKKKEKEKADSVADETPELTFIDFNISLKGGQDVNRSLIFTSSQPIASIEEKGIHLESLRDTIWERLQTPKIVRDSANRQLRYRLDYTWKPGTKYRFTADSASIAGINGDHNRPVAEEFIVKNLEDYSTLTLTLSGYPAGADVVVELLNSTDKPVMKTKAEGGVATFTFVYPDTYYLRAFIDSNGDGQWTTGNVAAKILPEDVYYYPRKLPLKSNWEVSQSWDLSETPVDRQKPNDIKKNKPKTKEKAPTNETDEDEEEDDFYNPRFGGSSSNRNNTGFRPGGVQSAGPKLR